MISVSIRDPFNGRQPAAAVEFRGDSTVADYLPESLRGGLWYVVRNGTAQSAKNAEATMVREGDALEFVPILGVESLALILHSQLLATIVVSTAISFALSYAIQLLIGQPEGPGDLDDDGNLFAPPANKFGLGSVIPVHYGEQRVGGTILNFYTTLDADGNPYGHVLVSLGHGRHEAIGTYTEAFDDVAHDAAGLAGVQLDENAIEAYEGVTVSWRPGEIDQTAIPGFNEAHDLQSVEKDLDQPVNSDGDPIGGAGEWQRHTTTQDVDAAIIHVAFPQGSNDPHASGGVSSMASFFDVRYRVQDAGGGSPGGWVYLVYDRATKTHTLTTSEGSAVPVSVVRKRFAPFTVHHRIDFAARTTYEIDVRRRNRNFKNAGIVFNTIDSNDSAHIPPSQYNAMQFQACDEIIDTALRYPGEALVAVRNIDLRQTGGNLPDVTATIKGRRVRVWDGVDPDAPTYAWKWTQNNAWIALDQMIDEEVGGGSYVQADAPDLESLLQMAALCDSQVSDGQGGTEDFSHFDGSFIESAPVWQNLARICQPALTQPVVVGGKVYFRPQQARSRTQVFGMGDIIADSFSRQWVDVEDAPNQIQVQFRDALNNYRADAFTFELPAVIEGAEPLKSKTHQMPDVVRESQAARIAKFLALLGRSVKQAVEIEVGARGLSSEVLDRVGIAHDVPSWSYASGLTAAGATATTIKLDRAVTLAAATTYRVLVTHADDTIEERTISSAAGDYAAGDALTVSAAWTETPAEDSAYMLGPSAVELQDFQLVRISRRPDLSHQLAAVTYDGTIFDEALDIDGLIEDASPTIMPDPRVFHGNAQYARLQRGSDRNAAGNVVQGLRASWSAPVDGVPGMRWALYMRKQASSTLVGEWEFVAETTGYDHFISGDLLTDASYQISVVAVNSLGAHAAPDRGAKASITFSATTNRPSNPAVRRSVGAASSVVVEWDEPGTDADGETLNTDLQRYEVRRGYDWRSAPVVGATPGLEVETFAYLPGGEHMLVKAINGARDESPTATACWHVAAPPDGKTLALDYSAKAVAWVGDLLLGGSVDTLGRLQDDAGVVSFNTGKLDLGSEDDWLVVASRWLSTHWLHWTLASVRLLIGAVTGGPFVAGELVTGGTSGATARVMVACTDGDLYLYASPVSGTLAADEVLTGGTSGATATTALGPISIPSDDATASLWTAAGPVDDDGLTLGSLSLITYGDDGKQIARLTSFDREVVRARYVTAIMTFGTADTARFQAFADDLRIAAWAA